MRVPYWLRRLLGLAPRVPRFEVADDDVFFDNLTRVALIVGGVAVVLELANLYSLIEPAIAMVRP